MNRSGWRERLAVLVFAGMLLPMVSSAQGTFPYLVKVHETPKPGSAFVVALGNGVATVVTAAHVVMGASRFEVSFAVEPGRRFTVDGSADFVGMQSDPVHGLAAFWVRGDLPRQVSPLDLDLEATVGFDETRPLVYVGYPNQARSPRRMTGSFAGVMALWYSSIDRWVEALPAVL